MVEPSSILRRDERCCSICGRAALDEIEAYRKLHRVTSDCRPWRTGGRLLICMQCGFVQTPNDEVFKKEIDEIYSAYTIYHQSKNGVEQSIFEQASGVASSRSRKLIATLCSLESLPVSGRMIDIGCGNGPLLRAFSEAFKGWTLAGSELDDKWRASIESIPGAEKLYVCPPFDIPGRFDLITMSHVAEHVTEPVDFLASLRDKLTPEGLLVILVPGCYDNPFELTVADHRSHFMASGLRNLIEQAGYEVLHAGDWIPKELCAIARVARIPSGALPPAPEEARRSAEAIQRRLQWLIETSDRARQLARAGPLGLFGTSIAGTWLAAELGDIDSFYFVDEDQSRVGRNFMGRPVVLPSQVAQGHRVFVGLPPQIAQRIARRLSRPGVEYFLPPPV